MGENWLLRIMRKEERKRTLNPMYNKNLIRLVHFIIPHTYSPIVV